jgi:hypothetical protein
MKISSNNVVMKSESVNGNNHQPAVGENIEENG